MFERFVRLARAREALAEGRLEEALSGAEDHLVRDTRKARRLRDDVFAALLGRARQRLASGSHAAALADVDRILRSASDHSEAVELREECRTSMGRVESRRSSAEDCVREARAATERGDCDRAREALANARSFDEQHPDLPALERAIEDRRSRAAQAVDQAQELLRGPQPDLAQIGTRLAAARDLDHAALDGRQPALVKALAPLVAAALDDAAGTRAWRDSERWLGWLPGLAEHRRFVAVRQRIADRLATDAMARLRDASTRAPACEEVRAWDSGLAEHPAVAEVVRARDAIGRADQAQDRGRFAEARDAWADAAALLGDKELRRRSEACAADHEWCQKRVGRARRALAEGRVDDAAEAWTEVVARWPLHEVARAELETIERGLQDRHTRLDEARAAAREGRLAEASTLAVALAVPGPGGAEARRLVDDVRGRMDLVQRGIDEVMALLHRRESATVEGLRHALGKVTQLESVQCDHDQLGRLRAALGEEIRGLERLDAVRVEDPIPAVEALSEVVALRSSLLAEDRLDARIQGAFDGLCARAEEQLAVGRLEAAEQLCSLTHALESCAAVPRARLDELRARVEDQKGEARSLAGAAEQRLRERDLTGAESAVSEAAQRWQGCPEVRRLEGELGKIRHQEAALREIDSLAQGQDVAAAQRKLAELPPTPALLRTRIFDMKKDLAQAQGLSGGFVLRVDEGGEFLVLRGDSVSIGNLRDGTADLPVLANVAARHATVRRSMSFHGGMEDRILADAGAVTVGGAPIAGGGHVLRSGVVVALGSSLNLRYTLPSSRSLTASVQLLGGFQVEGTDRVLLMKDRGRDGRILVGPAEDAHVRVGTGPEIEIYSNGTGQICVRIPKGADAEMGGRPIRGEHPVIPGELVRCGGSAFVLQPRQAR